MRAPTTTLQRLSAARRIADEAERLGIREYQPAPRMMFEHLGAALADATLQAGVNYRTVVQGRIERIVQHFPHAAALPGLVAIVEEGGVPDLLQWNHPVKIGRFVALVRLLDIHDVAHTKALRGWLQREDARQRLLAIHGVGPKTCDYLCCLVGIDGVAVDRHVRAFANAAGVTLSDYDSLRHAFSFAADLLNISRRDFDSWIWRQFSSAPEENLVPAVEIAPRRRA
jgi:hypothetical protein